MYELIVLGLIPGTQTQITFTTWLITAGILVSSILFWSTYRSQALRRTIVSVAMLQNVKRADANDLVVSY